MDVVRIGTRGSKLSLLQTGIVARKLELLGVGIKCELVQIKTLNEKIDRNSGKPTEKDIYTKEIDEALIDGSIDIAVHSLKDLKNELPKGILIASIPERADPRDMLVFGNGFDSNMKPRIGTSSIRRKVQIKRILPGAEVVELHGNVDTRLHSLKNGNLNALVLAVSGMERMGYSERSRILEPNEMIPAIGQGALAVTARSDDSGIIEILKRINDKKAESEIIAERSFGRVFGIGCDMPIGSLARANGNEMNILGFIAKNDGSVFARAEVKGKASDPEGMGKALARAVMEKGGDEIIESK